MNCVLLPPGYRLLERSGAYVLAHNPNCIFGRYLVARADRGLFDQHHGVYTDNIVIAVDRYVALSRPHSHFTPAYRTGCL